MDNIQGFLPVLDFVLAEVLCVFCHCWSKSSMMVLMYGCQTGRKRMKQQFAKRPLWDQIFMIKACLESETRRKEKVFYCGMNFLSYCIAIAEFIYFCVQIARDTPFDGDIARAIPIGLFLLIACSDHFLVPEIFLERDLHLDRATDFVVILMAICYFLIYVL